MTKLMTAKTHPNRAARIAAAVTAARAELEDLGMTTPARVAEAYDVDVQAVLAGLLDVPAPPPAPRRRRRPAIRSTGRDAATRVNGSGRVGYLPPSVTPAELTAAFGEDLGRSDKVTHEWNVVFADGTFAAIYDYRGHPWSIGGFSPHAVTLVRAALGLDDEEDA